MRLDYSHCPDYHFPHWIRAEVGVSEDDLNGVMDINHWLGEQVGELGTIWGYERERQLPGHINPYGSAALRNTRIIYWWRFQQANHAMLMKLQWST